MGDEPPDEEDEAHIHNEESTPVLEGVPDAPPILGFDEVFTALSHPRRRYLLYTLINESSEETLLELATKIGRVGAGQAHWRGD